VSRADRRARRAAERAQRWSALRERLSPGRPIVIAGLNTPVGGARVADALLEALERGDIALRAGELRHVSVLHDDDCPLMRGGRCCRCEPDVVPDARGAA
jgi:hypothetical protein